MVCRRCSASAALAAVVLLLAQEAEQAVALPFLPKFAVYVWGAASAENRRRRAQAAACDTVGVGEDAVDGDGMLVNVEGREGRGIQESEVDTTAAAPAREGAYVDGEGISEEAMELAYTNFACDPAWRLDTNVSWVCGEAGGVAMLSRQPCVSGIPPEGGVRLFYIIFASLCMFTYLGCWALNYEKVEKKEKIDDEGATPAIPATATGPSPPPPLLHRC